MNDELMKKLEQRMNRRTFLRGSALAAATFFVAAAFPIAAGAQSQDPQAPADKDDKTAKSKDKTESSDEKAEKEEAKKDAKQDGDAAEKDPFKEIKQDAQGRDYRMCPQCGYNMYRQDRTWTCENCGYSYVE
jgi:ribosomal protein S27AE